MLLKESKNLNNLIRYTTIVGFPIALVATGYWDPLIVGLWLLTENFVLILWESLKAFFYKNPEAHYAGEDLANATMLLIGICVFGIFFFRFEFGMVLSILDVKDFQPGTITKTYLIEAQQFTIFRITHDYIKVNIVDFISYALSIGSLYVGIISINLIQLKSFVMDFIPQKRYKGKTLMSAINTLAYLWLSPAILILIGSPFLLVFSDNLSVTILFCILYIALDLVIQNKDRIFKWRPKL